MNRNPFHSLTLKIGAAVLLIELIALCSLGVFYVKRFHDQVENGVIERVRMPGALMARGLMDYDSVSDPKMMRQLVGEELVEGMVVGVNGNVFQSLRPEWIGKDIGSVPQVEARWFSPEGVLVPQRTGTNSFLVSVTPVFAFDGKTPLLYAYIKVGTNEAEMQKQTIATMFILGSLLTIVFTSVVIIASFRVAISRRLAGLVDVLGRVESGHLGARVTGAMSGDEIGTVQRGVNSMTQRLQETIQTLEQRVIELRQTETALRESESRNVALIEAMPDTVLRISTHGEVLDFRSPAAQALPLLVAPPIGRKINELLPLEWAAKFLVWIDRTLAARELQIFDFQLGEGRDQQEFEARMVPRGDGEVIVIVRNVTERKRAEAEILKLAAFPRLNPEPVLEFAADGTLTYFNDAAKGMAFSLGREHPRELLPTDATEIVRHCLQTGQSRLQLERTYGNRTVSWSFFPIMNSRVVHCYASDITQRLTLEAQLRQSQKMESVGQLAAGVAHDFNNLLTVIQGYTTLLLGNEKNDPKTVDALKSIASSSERAADLTRQLLTFSRKQLLQTKVLDLNEVVGRVTQLLRRLLGEDIGLQCNYSPSLPPILADGGMMEQVIVNLAVNARDAMPKGGTLTITTRTLTMDADYARLNPEARAGRFVCLAIADTGCGMDKTTLDHIYEPFFTTKEVGKGTGLGLSTVYGIVKQHHGWIEVVSAVGKGTTFEVFLPITDQDLAVGDDARAASVTVLEGDETILVVEDEAAIRTLARQILEGYGYRVLEAESGVAALEVWQLHAGQIDLLLTDVVMPDGLTGYDLSDKLQAGQPDLSVVFSSGYSRDAVSEAEVNRDGTPFLQKPYQPTTLVQTVRAALDRRKARRDR